MNVLIIFFWGGGGMDGVAAEKMTKMTKTGGAKDGEKYSRKYPKISSSSFDVPLGRASCVGDGMFLFE